MITDSLALLGRRRVDRAAASLAPPLRPLPWLALALGLLGAPLSSGAPAAGADGRRPTAEEVLAQQTEELYLAAFRGKRSDEAIRDVAFRIASLRRGDLTENAPRIAALMGFEAGMQFSAARLADAEASLRRLLAFAIRGGNETLLVAGMRKMLSVPAYRNGHRQAEVATLHRLLAEHRTRDEPPHPERLQGRFEVALLDCIATAHMLDGDGARALALYTEAHELSAKVYAEIEVEDARLKDALTVTCRLFPLSGMLSSHLLMGQLDDALDVSDKVGPLALSMREAGLLPETHPARMAIEGALRQLAEDYAARQEATARDTGAIVPRTLVERAQWRRVELEKQAQRERKAAAREAAGEARLSPFVVAP